MQSTSFDNTALVSRLHLAIAEQTAHSPIETFIAALRKAKRVPTMLWDGSPPLPVQPSVSTYRFLTVLQRRMAAMGEDLWSPAAVTALKTHIYEHEGLLEALSESPSKLADQANDTAEASDAQTSQGSPNKDLHIQRAFDALYLARALSAPEDSKLVATADLDEAARQRLAKSANEYWKRTYLLFGLLAPQGM